MEVTKIKVVNIKSGLNAMISGTKADEFLDRKGN